MNPFQFISQAIFNLIFQVAKHVVTQQEVIEALTQLVIEYNKQLQTQHKVIILNSTHQKVPLVAIPAKVTTDPYEVKYNEMQIHPNVLNSIQLVCKIIIGNKAYYDRIQELLNVPWWFTAIIHYRESDFNFHTYLGNGQSLLHVTTIVPRGRGPFTKHPNFIDNFYDGAVDAFEQMGYIKVKVWTLGTALHLWERYNGMGYASKGLPSPYLWSGSNQYAKGKYVADGHFDPNVVDTQLGCATILKVLQTMTPISFS